MSFRNPFNRHNAAKKSAISRTAERDYERELKKVERLEEDSRKIYKDTKHCIDAQGAQSKCETKMASNLLGGTLCREDAEMRQTAEQWYTSTQRLEQLMTELNAISNKAVYEPMKKLCSIPPAVGAATKRREQSLQEYSRCQAKADKYSDRERTGLNRVKMEQSRKALAVAREDFEAQNSALMEDIPRLYEGRTDYIQPSFNALVQAQIKYYTEAHHQYADLLANVGQGADISDDQPQDADQNIQKTLAEMKALTITMDE